MIAIISDIHSNSRALKAVLKDIEPYKVKDIFCLGDTVNGYTDPNGVLDLLRHHNAVCTMGNHEMSILDKNAEAWISKNKLPLKDYTVNNINSDNLNYMKQFLFSTIKYNLYFVHSVPPDYIKRKLKKDMDDFGIEKIMSGINSKICFVGHSHKEYIYSEAMDSNKKYSRVSAVQIDQKIIDRELRDKSYTAGKFSLDRNKLYVVNVGSVGLSRGNSSHASYCLFDTESYRLVYRHIYYAIN